MKRNNSSLFFPHIFQEKILSCTNEITSKYASELEKSMLRQHEILTELTNIPLEVNQLGSNPLAIIIGTAQGMDNVHEAYLFSRELEARFGFKNVIFILSGAIGVSLNEYNKIGVPGVNAEVMGKMLETYRVDKKRILVENKSIHAASQAEEVSKILKKQKIKKGITFLDTWHGPRFYMTMINYNPNLTLYTQYINEDRDNVQAALKDYGQRGLQTPLFIAEIARIHYYFENKMGPTDIKGLMRYLARKHPQISTEKIKSQKFIELKRLWSKTNKKILKRQDYLFSYR